MSSFRFEGRRDDPSFHYVGLSENSIALADEQAEIKEESLLKNTVYYLNAGGLGTRLEPLLPKDEKLGITKALISFGGSPIVEYHLGRALTLGYDSVIIGAGHHNHVQEYVNGKLEYIPKDKCAVVSQDKQYGTGGDLILTMREYRNNQSLIVIQNVDTLLDVPEDLVVKQHVATGAGATVVLTSRRGVPNEGAYGYDANKKVIYCREATLELRLPEPDRQPHKGSSTGMIVVNKDLVVNYPWDSKKGGVSLYSQMLGWWTRLGIVYAFDNADRFFMDIGTPVNFNKVQRHPILKTILDNRVKI